MTRKEVMIREGLSLVPGYDSKNSSDDAFLYDFVNSKLEVSEYRPQLLRMDITSGQCYIQGRPTAKLDYTYMSSYTASVGFRVRIAIFGSPQCSLLTSLSPKGCR